MTPVLVELSRRSSDADRGSAFALYSGSLASAISLGSIGGAPLVATIGMSATLGIGIALIGASVLLALGDPLMRDPRREAALSLQTDDEAAEGAVETPSALT
jgi:predicted MFS family arabinose efflux permease